jgi:hypothetical protein
MMSDIAALTGLQDIHIAVLLAGLAVLFVLILLSRMGRRQADGRRQQQHKDGSDGTHIGISAGSSKGSGKGKDNDSGGDGDGDSDGGGDGGGD